MSPLSRIASSSDGTPIHYDVYGNGEPALVFVHGWCCNRSYWDKQVSYFAQRHSVVVLDLAGHGASGQGRATYSLPLFGQDVVAVVEQLGLRQVVLVGHSMGGPVIVEAARRMPARVLGLVGADTWHDLSLQRTQAQVDERLVPFRSNFVEAAQNFVRSMFLPTSDPALVDSVLAGMTAAPPHIGLEALAAVTGGDRLTQEGFRELRMPRLAINAAGWRRTNTEAAQEYGLDITLMAGIGHFVMMEDAATFNQHLEKALQTFRHAR